MTDEAGFVDALVTRGREFGGSVLFPVSDESTVAVSRNKHCSRSTTALPAPTGRSRSASSTSRGRTRSRRAHGVPAPRTAVPTSEADLAGGRPEDRVSRAPEARREPPVLRAVQAEDGPRRHESDWWTPTGRPSRRGCGDGPGDHSRATTRAVVNYNAYFLDGRPLVEFTARQLRKAPPALGSPRVAVSERIPEVIEPGRRILAAHRVRGLRLHRVQARQPRRHLQAHGGQRPAQPLRPARRPQRASTSRSCTTGTWPMASCPRPSRTGPASTGRTCSGTSGTASRTCRRERYRLPDYLAPYARRHCDAILDRNDMGPFWARLGYLARNSGATARTAIGAPARGGSSRAQQAQVRGDVA